MLTAYLVVTAIFSLLGAWFAFQDEDLNAFEAVWVIILIAVLWPVWLVLWTIATIGKWREGR